MHSMDTTSDAQAIAATKPLILILNSKEEESGDGKRSIRIKILHIVFILYKEISLLDA